MKKNEAYLPSDFDGSLKLDIIRGGSADIADVLRTVQLGHSDALSRAHSNQNSSPFAFQSVYNSLEACGDQPWRPCYR
jgi:hypothetical protein